MKILAASRSMDRLLWLLLVGLFIALFLVKWKMSPTAYDWQCFHDAFQNVLAGKSPYQDTGFYSPPWILILLFPFFILPEQVGAALVSTTSIFTFAAIAWKMGSKPVPMVFFLLSPGILIEFVVGNVNWLASIGLLLPTPIGLFFLMLKPQLAVGVVIFWAAEAWREGGLRRVIRNFAPVTAAYLLSFLVFGPYPLQYGQVVDEAWNMSLWPLSIPIGVLLIYHAVRSRKLSLAILASPFLTPYFASQSLSFVLLGLAASPVELILASIGMWLAITINGSASIWR